MVFVRLCQGYGVSMVEAIKEKSEVTKTSDFSSCRGNSKLIVLFRRSNHGSYLPRDDICSNNDCNMA